MPNIRPVNCIQCGKINNEERREWTSFCCELCYRKWYYNRHERIRTRELADSRLDFPVIPIPDPINYVRSNNEHLRILDSWETKVKRMDNCRKRLHAQLKIAWGYYKHGRWSDSEQKCIYSWYKHGKKIEAIDDNFELGKD